MSPASYSHVFRLPVAPATAFELFSNPFHLDSLTPSWFRLLPQKPVPDPLSAGAEITYRLRWRGLPMRWTSRITDWDSPSSFSYEQKVGPYRLFRHEHYFTEVDGGTEIHDHAVFEAPGGNLVNRLIAGPDLRRIFEHRERRALELLDRLQSEGPDPRAARRIPRTRASSSAIERPT